MRPNFHSTENGADHCRVMAGCLVFMVAGLAYFIVRRNRNESRLLLIRTV